MFDNYSWQQSLTTFSSLMPIMNSKQLALIIINNLLLIL
jgi:hypothetical protein